MAVIFLDVGACLCHNLCLPWAIVKCWEDEWDEGVCQVLAWVGELAALVRCWFMGSSQCLSGAGLWGAHSACQVLVYGELTVLVRCWFMRSSQCLPSAGS